jgi:hypothetical protein
MPELFYHSFPQYPTISLAISFFSKNNDDFIFVFILHEITIHPAILKNHPALTDLLTYNKNNNVD